MAEPRSSTYTKPHTPGYDIIIKPRKKGIIDSNQIHGTLAEEFTYTISNTYSAVVDGPPMGFMNPLTVSTRGHTLESQWSSRKFFSTTEYIQFDLPMVFAVFENPIVEIMQPIRDIQKLSLPGRTAKLGFLTAPPDVFINIVGVIYANRAQIINVSPAFSREKVKYPPGEGGELYPSTARLNLTVGLREKVDREKFDAMFLNAS